MQLGPKRISTRTAIAVGALALAGGGGAVALAASGSGSGSGSGGERKALIDDAAARLGVQPAALQSALQAAAADRADAAVKAGRISKETGDAIKARIKDGTGPLLGGGRARGLRRGAHVRRALGAAAASYLGLTLPELRSELQSGKSLANVASDKGKPVDALEAAILDAAKAGLDRAVRTGRISADQERQRLDALKPRIAAAVQRAGLGRGPAGAHAP